MIYRSFWLTNNVGDTYSLNSSKAFLYTPEGLGFTSSYEAMAIGNVEVITAELINLNDVSGELLFNGGNIRERYQEYTNFVDFIREKPLKLHYLPPNLSTSYSASVVITSLEKSEIDSDDGLLHCPISMHMSTHWTSDEYIEIVIDANQLNGKSYPLDYPYAYGSFGLNNITLINKGTEDIGVEIEIIGGDNRIENPSYSLYDANKVLYGVGAWTGTFDYFYINTIYEEENVILKDGSITLTDPLNYQNLNQTVGTEDADQLNITFNFVQLRSGKSTMAVSFANEFDGIVKVRFKPRYATI